MTKFSIREFKLAGRGEDGLRPWLDERGAFVGGGVALLKKDNFGDFAPLPRRELETILSAGYGIAVDLGSRMHGLALAKAMNQGDHALATIVLVQLQFPALPDKGAGARMRKAAAMLDDGATARCCGIFCPTATWRSLTRIILAPALEAENSPRRKWTGRVPGMRAREATSRLSEDEILDEAQDNPKRPAGFNPRMSNRATRRNGAKLDPISSAFGKECWVTSRSDKKDLVIQYMVEYETITAIDVYPPAAEAFPLSILAIRTPEGIGVGSTEELIRKAYGNSAKKERAPYFDEDNKDNTAYWFHVDNPAKKLGMIFDVQYGRVLSFSVGMLEAINRMEGCI